MAKESWVYKHAESELAPSYKDLAEIDETIILITDANFEDLILKSPVPVLVDCFADWCAPCKALTPLLVQLAHENPNINLGMLNIEYNPQLAAWLKVNSIPKVFLFNNGEEIESLTGLHTKDRYKQLLSI